MICSKHNHRYMHEFEPCPFCLNDEVWSRRFDRVLRVVGLILFGVCIGVMLAGCAHDNGIIYKPAPKPSTASEVDTYIKSAGGVARFLGLGADAK